MDRTAKALLALAIVGLWGLLLRPLFMAPLAAEAQIKLSGSGSALGPAPDSPAMVLQGGQYGDKVVVSSRGKISVWLVNYDNRARKSTLTLQDTKPLP
jgi:hypothetical protein